ncbi:hypothetical protein FTO68_02590 [Methanocalculus taiwanensis]|uniref:Uncharacterized protein n=1 Tax=Methanocalculus taiwanensis TaxID=106207 RepID=A0ABD4TGL7_9EURY|nr:hypothetical protein [Methanocalculus taiwanensis]MCQ1537876.1 hypothetical protein [Methanocalculus taiwanensis]
MLDWLRENCSSFEPNRALAIRALRHLKKGDNLKLFSDDIMEMRTVEGYWYEALIYELLLETAGRTNAIKKIVKKGPDAPRRPVRIALGQNGMYYAEKGDIRVRGNGQDLAEVDLLLIDNHNQVSFAEIVTSPADLKDLEAEIHYKKKLFGYLFRQETVEFSLFSAVDISNTQVIKRLCREEENAYVGTFSCEELKASIRSLRLASLSRQAVNNPKLISALSLRTRPFDYRQFHDQALSRLLHHAGQSSPQGVALADPGVSPLVKKVIFGAMNPAAQKELVNELGMRVKSTILDYGTLTRDYSKVVFAVDLPDLSPVVYIKPKKRRMYYKMVPEKTGGFKYERQTPGRVGFYLWLESAKPAVSTETMYSLLDLCNRR